MTVRTGEALFVSENVKVINQRVSQTNSVDDNGASGEADGVSFP